MKNQICCENFWILHAETNVNYINLFVGQIILSELGGSLHLWSRLSKERQFRNRSEKFHITTNFHKYSLQSSLSNHLPMHYSLPLRYSSISSWVFLTSLAWTLKNVLINIEQEQKEEWTPFLWMVIQAMDNCTRIT